MTADEKLKELGFMRHRESADRYVNTNDNDRNFGDIVFGAKDFISLHVGDDQNGLDLTAEEVKAIYEKCHELGYYNSEHGYDLKLDTPEFVFGYPVQQLIIWGLLIREKGITVNDLKDRVALIKFGYEMCQKEVMDQFKKASEAHKTPDGISWTVELKLPTMK